MLRLGFDIPRYLPTSSYSDKKPIIQPAAEITAWIFSSQRRLVIYSTRANVLPNILMMTFAIFLNGKTGYVSWFPLPGYLQSPSSRWVEIGGVIPNAQTSSGCPVHKQNIRLTRPTDYPFPRSNIFQRWVQHVDQLCEFPWLHGVLPELEINNNKSFSCNMPKSPCCASLGCRNTAGMPVEQNIITTQYSWLSVGFSPFR